MTSQRFCLRWNNHQSNLLSVFDQLLQDESFVDVTLAVDGRNLKAHKIVLSACSPYFQALFVGHPDRHPIVILKDIPYVDMRSLLDFMYRGEVSVDQDRLTMFLKVAESLRIKGLTEASGDNCDTLAKMGSTLTTTPHPYSGGLGFPPSRLKRPLSGSQHSLNSLQASNPLLGSALTGPKRKRGLPRKLSGSLSSGLDVMPDREEEEEEEREEEEEEEEEEAEEERSVQSDSDMVERAHSPFDNKMLEVNVSEGKTPHRPARPSSPALDDSSSACNVEDKEEGGRSPLPSPRREDEEEKQSSQEVSSNTKKEKESEATSGGDQSDRNSSPVPERFPPGLLRLIPRSELISKDKLDAPEPTRGRPKANGNQSFDNLHLLKSLIMNNNVKDFANNSDENQAQFLSQFSNEHKFILSQLEQLQKTNKKDMLANSNFSLHVQSQHIHQMLTNNNNNNGGVNENHNFLAPNNAGSSPLAVKRRIRRRATSGSDPTESLTEMSVRGLNLFRYASVTEGPRRARKPHLRTRPQRKPLSQAITYELNPDVSLTRGIVYEVEGREEEKEEEVVPWRRRRGRRRKVVQADYGAEAADVVECEDVLRSLMTSSSASVTARDEQDGYLDEPEEFGSGVHFLTSESLLSFIQSSDMDDSNSSSPSPLEDDILTRKDLLEYLMNKDGSCVCKLCGEVLSSRTHWYRHKYKVHTPAHLAPPPVEKSVSDLHTCKVCKQYFKSKKGYLGHVHAKHNSEYAREVSAQVTPVLPSVGEVTKLDKIIDEKDYGKAREMEEQLVKDIIAKVRRECEQEGDGVMMMMRRGYAKKMKKLDK